MSRYVFILLTCVVFFFLPLNIFIIGDNVGIGIQGAVYRYQTTIYGDSFITLMREITFVLNGTLTGKTALSVVLWVSGTALLTCTLIFTLMRAEDAGTDFYRQGIRGILVSCLVYLASCIAQYGFLFKGPAGLSLPVGIVLILFWIAFFIIVFPGPARESPAG